MLTTPMHMHSPLPSRPQVPVLVSELDLECKLWIKLRLAPLPPHVGTISLAFVGQPTVRVQLAPYNRVRLMRIPILQVVKYRHALSAVLVCCMFCSCMDVVENSLAVESGGNFLVHRPATCTHS